MLTSVFNAAHGWLHFYFLIYEAHRTPPLCLIYDLGFAVLENIGDLNLSGKQIFLAKHYSGLSVRGETTHMMTAI